MPSPSAIDRDPVDDDLRLFTFDQVGELFGISGQTVRRMVASGQIKTVQVWGKTRISAPAIRAYIQRADRSYRPGVRAS